GGALLGPGGSADGRGRSVRDRGRRLDGRGRSTGRGVPILGRVAAGGPLLAAENIEGHFDAGRLARLGGDFALRIQGESMRGAGILPGDIVLVRSDPEPGDGEIVVALIGDEATVKRFRREPGRVVLQPENPDYAPLVLDESSPPLRILGRVVGVYRELA
ncbi:MAG: repressor LexA, partial [Candidatus Eisenbacteria bacterium]|nr:repressor LexA [Candidatus Eisenbacteria bacterium]